MAADENVKDSKVKAEADVGAGIENDVSRAQKTAPKNGAEKIGNQTAILNGEIEIFPARPLPEFDRGPVKAYVARREGEAKDNYFALVCEMALVPRTWVGGSFAGISNSSLVRLVASGVTYWPISQEQRYVFVYENKVGKPLMAPGHMKGLGWKQDIVMEAVIKPMVGVLREMRNVDLVHGNINPSNMFDGGSRGAIERVVLGECLSLPPSYAQPVLYETIDRAMASPIARGIGTMEDDLYSFGVSLVMFLCNKDFSEESDNDEIVARKVEMGSYSALTGNERFTGPILELLRGLLYDERAQRWTLDEVMQWLDGQRLSPKQSAKKINAARPVPFNNERYFLPSMLAYDFHKNPAEAVQLIENGQLEQWIERSLEDSTIMTRFEQAVETAQEGGRGPGYSDRLIARVSVALDPDAPLRYKEWAVHPDGIPYALVETYNNKGNISPFVDIIEQQLVLYWLNAQQDMRIDVSGLANRYDNCRVFLRQKTVGFGIERCLYFLHRDCPCLSDKIKGYYVRSPEDLLYAFEDMADKPDRPDLFIDRHIAAFLSVKDSKNIDAYMIELNAKEYHSRVFGNLMTLATIQKRARLEPLPGLSRWVADIVEPVYERFHDREMQKKIRSKVDKIKDSGDLTKIAALLSDEDAFKKDFLGFQKAMHEYNELCTEYYKLEKKKEQPEKFGRQTGADFAALVSGVIAGIVILAFSFLYFTSGKIF